MLLLYVVGSIAFGHRGQFGVLRYCAPFSTPATLTDYVIVKVIFEFVSNLARERIPLGGQG